MSKEQLSELIRQAVSEKWAGKRLDDAIDEIFSQFKPAKK
jgi:hypothetical protein